MAPFLCRPQLVSLPTSATVGMNHHRRLQTDAKSAEDTLRVFLVERLQRLERYVDVSRRGVLREEDATDNSLSVDDVGHAPRQPESCGHAVALSEYTVCVAQQDKGELVLFGELSM